VTLLLDTVTLYRAATTSNTLPDRVRERLSSDTHKLFVSIASAWELAIKTSLGKLALPCPVEDFFAQTTRDLVAECLAVDLKCVAKVAELPHHHKDPFDRMLIAQAKVHGLAVVTSDPRFANYGVDVIW
jgi:PIN domain nuclease of toxin-antitoxin system